MPSASEPKVSQFGMRRVQTSATAAIPAAETAQPCTSSINACVRSVRSSTLGADGGDVTGESLKPDVDAASKDADSNQDHDCDRGDQQPVLDDILSRFVLNEARKPLHVPFPLMADGQGIRGETNRRGDWLTKCW